MRVGFTGTRNGMTKPQIEATKKLLVAHNPTEFHHGDCVGADAEAHRLARSIRTNRTIPFIHIEVHPPNKDVYRAFCQGDVIHPVADYVVRDHAIVDATEVLIACPGTFKQYRGSGTWLTYRYARDHSDSQIFIVFPDGTVLDRSKECLPGEPERVQFSGVNSSHR